MPTSSRASSRSLSAASLLVAMLVPGLALAQGSSPSSEPGPGDPAPDDTPPSDASPEDDGAGADSSGTSGGGTGSGTGGTTGPTHLPSHTTEGGSSTGGTTSTGGGTTGRGTGTTATGTTGSGTGSGTTGRGTAGRGAGTGAATGAAAVGEEEEEDEGDGRDVDFLYIEIEGGVSDVNLIAFRGGDLFGGPGSLFEEIRGTGPFAGLGLGFRVYWIALGARVTYANYQNFDIGNVGGDLTLRLPIPIVEPYARVGFGYAWQGQANYSNPSMSATTVYGWSFDAALGVDIYLTNWFTIGAGFGFNVLNMSRQRDPSMPCMAITDICPGNPGDAVGYQLRGFGQIAFRF